MGSYQGRWAGVSGYLEVDDPEDQLWTELAEELGLTRESAVLEQVGAPFEVRDRELGRAWLVHPFRLVLASGVEPRLDWEHVELRWVAPRMILDMDTVPGLWDAWLRVEGGDAAR